MVSFVGVLIEACSCLQAAVDLVIAPSDLDITLADIGALDDLLDKLVSYALNKLDPSLC